MGFRGGRGVVATETRPLLLKVLFSANESRKDTEVTHLKMPEWNCVK